MPSPLSAAGATTEPTQYAPLTMDRYLTGMWTQRGPLRDADVPYAYARSYGNRYDSMIDGLNREISAKLTLIRRPGNSPFNSSSFAAIQSFYSFSYIVDNTQQISVMADTAGIVLDATPPGSSAIFNKSAGAGPARFLGVGNECFFGDGIDEEKWLKGAKTRKSSTSYNVGDLIIDSNGNLQKMYAGLAIYTNVGVEIVNSTVPGANNSYVRLSLGTRAPKIPVGMTATFSGFTGYPALNGKTLAYQNIPVGLNVAPTTSSQVVFEWGALLGAYGPSADTGTMTVELNQPGVTASSAPTFATTWGAITTDGTVHWRNFGAQVQNWGLIGPTDAPVLALGALTHFWAPGQIYSAPFANKYYYFMDSSGNLQVLLVLHGAFIEGGQDEPPWNPVLGQFTPPLNWVNCGVPGTWKASTPTLQYQSVLDSNGNLQFASAITGTGITGATPPTWATTPVTTTDNQVTWQFLGPGIPLTTGGFGYGVCYHGIDGTLSTVSQKSNIPGTVLGKAGGFEVDLQGHSPADLQCDEIWIYRISQDGALLLRLDKIPNPGSGIDWTYRDTLPDDALNPFLQAPIGLQGSPPPDGFTAPVYHLQRVFGVVANQVFASEGPDAVARGANGATAFNPLVVFSYPSMVIRLEAITVNGGGVLVFTTTNVYIILGTGTSSDPFITKVYIRRLGILGYNAVDIIGSTFYIFTNNKKMISLDPAAGFMEIGYPIGDQFNTMTTGPLLNRPTFNPATTYVSWHEKHSGDTAIYVSDGTVGWFRYSPIATPESGYLWSPWARIEGGTSAVQSVEVAPGVRELLIGPKTLGPILKRDESIHNDNGTIYPSYVIIGSIKLCDPGEIAEVAFVTVDSVKVGARPGVGLLLGEIAPTPNVSWDLLDYTSPDPPELPASETLFNSRYVAMQNGVCPKCRHMQLLIYFVDQDFNDEVYTHTIYGAIHAERRQQ